MTFPRRAALTIEAIRAGVDNDDEWVLNEALLLLAVVLAEEGSPRDARRVVAATGWDVDPPEGLRDYTNSNFAMGLARLEPVLVAAYDDAAADGRRAGRVETARAVLAAETS